MRPFLNRLNRTFDSAGYRVDLFLQVLGRLAHIWKRRLLINEQL